MQQDLSRSGLVYLLLRLQWPLLAVTLLMALVSLTMRLAGAVPATATASPLATPTTAGTDPYVDLAAAPANKEITQSLAITTASTDRLVSTASAEIFVQAVSEDLDTFNPVLSTNATTGLVARKLFPTLLEQDPQSGLLIPSLASGWQSSPDGRAYTLTLRSDLFWSDGQPVTAQDVQFTYAAMVDEGVQSPWRTNLEPLEGVAAHDAHTVVVTLRQADCAALQLLRYPLLPSHRYSVDFSDLRSNSLNNAPLVTAGPFRFAEWTAGAQIRLLRNPDFWRGPPHLAEWQARILPDPASQVAALLDGTVDGAVITPAQAAELAGNAGIVRYAYPTDSYSVLALNLADPRFPQPGQDASGAALAQTPHPILGDSRVRRALALALDYPALLKVAYGEQSYRLASFVLPSLPWAYDGSLTPYSQDQIQAAALLSAAGWLDNDGDGIRERAGERLSLRLLTNDDSAPRQRMGELVAQQLGQLGFAIEFTPVPFEEMAATLLNQQFDLAIAGWEQVGADPATSTFWHRRDDMPGSGLNFVSWQDAEVDRWLDEAAQVPGCAAEQRGEWYRQVQRRLYEQTAAIFLGGPLDSWAYQARWRNLQPGPWGLDANINEWSSSSIDN